MTPIVITLSLPPPCLLPNRQGRSVRFARWKSAEKRKAKEAAFYKAREAVGAVPPLWPAATIQATYYLPNRRGMDADQDGRIAQLKAHADGIAEAGVVANDRGLTWLPVRHEVDKADPRLVLTVTEQN